jgi:hypothetical protein
MTNKRIPIPPPAAGLRALSFILYDRGTEKGVGSLFRSGIAEKTPDRFPLRPFTRSLAYGLFLRHP